jgi:hypothetical protein
VGSNTELLLQLAIAKDFDSNIAIGEPSLPQSVDVYAGAVIEPIQGFKVHRNVANRVAGVVETTLWNTPNERHLSAFETDADGTAGPGRLAFTATAGSFSVTTRFTLAKPLATMLGAGPWF